MRNDLWLPMRPFRIACQYVRRSPISYCAVPRPRPNGNGKDVHWNDAAGVLTAVSRVLSVIIAVVTRASTRTGGGADATCARTLPIPIAREGQWTTANRKRQPQWGQIDDLTVPVLAGASGGVIRVRSPYV